MDLQSAISNQIAVDRAEKMKRSDQLTLGELILKLEACPNPDAEVYYEFHGLFPTSIDSWRGSYSELALNVSGSLDRYSAGAPLQVSALLTILKEAVGKTFTGYKGGEYLMGKTTPVWVANYGATGSETAVIDVRYDGSQYCYLTTGKRDY